MSHHSSSDLVIIIPDDQHHQSPGLEADLYAIIRRIKHETTALENAVRKRDLQLSCSQEKYDRLRDRFESLRAERDGGTDLRPQLRVAQDVIIAKGDEIKALQEQLVQLKRETQSKIENLKQQLFKANKQTADTIHELEVQRHAQKVARTELEKLEARNARVWGQMEVHLSSVERLSESRQQAFQQYQQSVEVDRIRERGNMQERQSHYAALVANLNTIGRHSGADTAIGMAVREMFRIVEDLESGETQIWPD